MNGKKSNFSGKKGGVYCLSSFGETSFAGGDKNYTKGGVLELFEKRYGHEGEELSVQEAR